MMDFLADYGYIGLFLGSFIAATIVPFSSDLLLAAILIAGFDPVVSVAVATAGNWLGGLTLYGMGRLGKCEWIEKWTGVSEAKLERQRERISRHGALVALLSWVPVAGDAMVVALGFYRVDFVRSSVFILIGRAARYAALALIHYWVAPLF